MRWEDLFTDLEIQFAGLQDAALRSELSDHERVAVGSVSLVERLAGSVGGPLKVGLISGLQCSGKLVQVGIDWVLLADNAGAELLAPLARVIQVEGLTSRTGGSITGAGAKFDLRRALRTVARDRSPVTVTLTNGAEIAGTLDRIGTDFVELAVHAPWEARRPATVQSVALLPFGGIDLVRAIPLG